MRTGTLLALATSALLTCASADINHHAHELFHRLPRHAAKEAEEANQTCFCTTTYMTYYGEPTRM